jgi:hypothetical protein
MRFTLEQAYAAPPEAVAAAYADPALYDAFGELPRAGRPQVLSHVAEGDLVVLEVRWSFTAPLSSAARAVIDPDRLSWVQRSTHDLANLEVDFEMLPDHYADRFSCTGDYWFVDDGQGGTTRRTEGDLRVRAPLVGRAVEGAIIDGLKEQLGAEIPLVERFVKG